MKKALLFSLLATSFAVIASPVQPINLYSALDYYGITTPEQKQAIRYLMQQAEIPNANAILDTKTKNSDELFQQIQQFVTATQQKFTMRSGNQERWEITIPAWMQDTATAPQILASLNALNLIAAQPPKFTHTDALIIFGATGSTMNTRLKYAADLITTNQINATWLIFLVGERYVTLDQNGISLDGTQESLEPLAKSLHKTVDKLTETDLAKNLYRNSALYNKIPMIFIDTPRGLLSRPTTETTLLELCKWLKAHPEVARITFVSNQPYIGYQTAITDAVLKNQKIMLDYEVIGPDIAASSVHKNQAYTIRSAVEALGTQIWAQTPAVVEALELHVNDSKQWQEFVELYKKQPLIYSELLKFQEPNKRNQLTPK